MPDPCNKVNISTRQVLQTFWFLNADKKYLYTIRSDQSLSRVRLFVTPWIAAHQASLSITNSRSSLRLTSIESVMPSSHLILRCPLLLPPPIPPSIRVFSNESIPRIRWPKYWSFSFSLIVVIQLFFQNTTILKVSLPAFERMPFPFAMPT